MEHTDAVHEAGCRRTFRMGVINGALYNASSYLIDATVVLSVMGERLIGSKTLVGLLLAMINVGWMWPALFTPWFLEGRTYKMPWYRGSCAFRIAGIGAVAAILFSPLPVTSPVLCFWLITIVFFIQTSSGGVSWLPFMDIVGKTVPPNRRGLFWALRQCISGCFGIGAASLVRWFLDPANGQAFPRGYAWLVTFAAVMQTAAIVLFAFAYEPPSPSHTRRMSLRMYFARRTRLLRRDPALRIYLTVRIVLSLAAMGVPFLALYGHKRFGLSEAETGGLLLPVTIAGAILPYVWGAVSDRLGSRAAIRTAAVLGIAHAVLPLVLSGMAPAGLSPHVVRLMLGGSMVFGYAMTTCWGLAMLNYVLDLAPAHRRDAYVGLNTGAAIPLAFGSLFAGALGDFVSMEAIYWVCLALAAMGAAWSFFVLPEPRTLKRQGG